MRRKTVNLFLLKVISIPLLVVFVVCSFPCLGTAQTAAQEEILRGRDIFRFETFGDQAFWGRDLRMHEAIKGAALGGVGPGLSPRAALGLGLKVDVNALPADLQAQLRAGTVNLDDPAVTVALLKLNAVVGVTGFFDPAGNLVSFGIQCALCHTTVNQSLALGIGDRRDGWANRDLNVGAIIAFAPNLTPVVALLRNAIPGITAAQVRTVLNGWGPGKFDAELFLDGKTRNPINGRSSATLIPPIFGLAGVNLHTWTGWGAVPYWNAFVAVLEMHGQGNFFDSRLNDPVKFPVAAAAGSGNVRVARDQVTPRMGALHLYQMSLAPPAPPAGSFNRLAAARGEVLFKGKARCARCHVPPLFTEPGWNMHTPLEVGIDAFQANRSPDGLYRTTPLRGLWSHRKGGFFHDGRFQSLQAVVSHFNRLMTLGLLPAERADLVQYLLSL